MRAGRLNKRITLQSLTAGQDEYGAPSNVWANVISGDDPTIAASISDLTGREYVSAGGTQNEVTTKILIRKREGVTATMRALHGSVVYSIETALEQDDDRILLMCVRGSDNG